jgi:hypothetical protein
MSFDNDEGRLRYYCPKLCGFDTDNHAAWMAHHCAPRPDTLADLLENAPFGPIKIPKAYTPNPLNTQEGGDHYKKLKIQPIEYIHANGIPFAEGCAIKYLTRWRDKGGVEDLKKARHFIDLLIELETRK